MSKTIVIYFSRADENYAVDDITVGNTEILAKEIIKEKAADEFKIVPVVPYPKDYQSCVEQATREGEGKLRPEYQGDVDISEYDTVYLGYPIWWGDLPMIVYSFIEKHDFSGKTVLPFCTHEGSGESGTYAKLDAAMSGATVQDGLDMYGHVARTERGIKKLHTWLENA